MSRLRHILFSAGLVLTSALSIFLAYRAVVSALGIDALGIWSFVMAGGVVLRVAEFGVPTSSIRLGAAALQREDGPLVRGIYETGLISTALTCLAAATLAYPLISLLAPAAILHSRYVSEFGVLLTMGLTSSVVGSAGNVSLAMLECHRRYDLRAAVLIAGNIAFLLACMVLLGRVGILSLGLAAVAQSTVVASLGWLICRRLNGLQNWLPTNWSIDVLRSLLRDGAKLQTISVLVVLLEPMVRFMFVSFGGLAAAGTFELANQLISKVKQLVSSATGIAVPQIARIAGERAAFTTARIRAFSSSYGWRTAVLVPLAYLAAAAISPTLGYVWIGEYDRSLVMYVFLLGACWSINSAGIIPYYVNQGLGRTGSNLLMHLVQTGLFLVLGMVAGRLWGDVGILLAIAAATGISTTYIVWKAEGAYGAKLFEFVPPSVMMKHTFLYGSLGSMLFLTPLLPTQDPIGSAAVSLVVGLAAVVTFRRELLQISRWLFEE